MNKNSMSKLLSVLLVFSICVNFIAPTVQVYAKGSIIEKNFQEEFLTFKSLDKDNKIVEVKTPVVMKNGLEYVSIEVIAKLTRSEFLKDNDRYIITHGGKLRTLEIDSQSKVMTDTAIQNVEYDISLVPQGDSYLFPAAPLLRYLGAYVERTEKGTMSVSMPNKTYWEAVAEVPYNLLYVDKQKNIALRSVANRMISFISTLKTHETKEMLPEETVFGMMKVDPQEYESVNPIVESKLEKVENTLELFNVALGSSADYLNFVNDKDNLKKGFMKNFLGSIKSVATFEKVRDDVLTKPVYIRGIERSGQFAKALSVLISASNNVFDRALTIKNSPDFFKTVVSDDIFELANYKINPEQLESINNAIEIAENVPWSVAYELGLAAINQGEDILFDGLVNGTPILAISINIGLFLINRINEADWGRFTPFGLIDLSKAEMQIIYSYLLFEEFENLRNALLPVLDAKGINTNEDFERDVHLTNVLLRSAIFYRERVIDYIKAEMFQDLDKVEIIEKQLERLARSLYDLENLNLDNLTFYEETEFVEEEPEIPSNSSTQAFSTERVTGIIRNGNVYQIGSFYDTNSDELNFLTEFQPLYVMDNIESVKVGASGNDSYAESFFAKSNNGDLYGWGSMNAYSDIVYTHPTLIDQGIDYFSKYSSLGLVIYNKNGLQYLYDTRGGLPGYELGVPLSLQNLNNVPTSNNTYTMLGDDGRIYSGLDNEGRPVVTTREERLKNPSDILQTFFVHEEIDDNVMMSRLIILRNDNNLYYVGLVDKDSEDYSEETLFATNVKKAESLEYEGIAYITDANDLYVLGGNLYGVLGVGHYDRVVEPTLIMNDVKDIRFSKDKSGYSESGMSILTNNGEVYITGVYEVPWQWYLTKNQWGEYRKPLYTTEYGVAIPQLMTSGVREFASGNGNVVVKEDNSVWSWGYNNYGELGGVSYLQDTSIDFEDEDGKFVFPIELFTGIQ